MTLLGEASNVFSEGFAWLLPATLQVPGVARSHIRALDVAREDPLEILPTIDHISRQVVQLGPRRVG
jgi:hypothetical protein